MTSLIEAIGLKRYFPVSGGRHLRAVDGVDLALGEDDSLGVVGESGSGKSTLARLVARLIDPTDGAILLEGRDIARAPAKRFAADPARRDIQLVFQNADDALNPAFTIARNIAIGLGRTRINAEALEKVKAIADDVGLTTDQLSRRPHQLSGGQQARVGIARALISNPRLLVLDEPTASLDVSVQATVLKLIDRLRSDQNISLIFVSHDLEVVRLMCRQVLVLYLGRVAETGPVGTVLSAPRHPYTRALVAATPGRGTPRPLPGEPTSPIDPPQNACLLAGRCPLAIDRCRIERPMLQPIAGRLVACHRAEETTTPEQAPLSALAAC